MQETKVIGITGGIGSGKSIVCEIFKRDYQAHLINMDQIAHSLMEPGAISYELIVKFFGKEILDAANRIDRKKLGELVYKDENQLMLLNSCTHPYVLDYVRNEIQDKKSARERLICVESALPKEAKLTELCDEVWYVKASDNLRRERLIHNRNYSKDKIDHIFGKQISDKEYKKIGTKIIINETSQEDLVKQIKLLLKK